MQQFHKFFIDVYVSLNMFRAPPRPSSGAYNGINNLWFYLGAWWQQCCWSWSGWPARPRPTMLLPPRSKVKPEAL